ncbi:MAG: GTP-binding protein, partial [Pseudomonadota bacterium]
DHDHEHDDHHHHHHHDHDHDEFETFVVSGETIEDRDALISGLKSIIEDHDILRLKGFVAVAGKPMRLVVQAVGNRVDHYFDREWTEAEAPNSRLVVIGLEGMKQDEISSSIKALIG